MADNKEKPIVAVHPDYSFSAPSLKAVRDCVIGSEAITKAGYIYLPHPSQIDPTSAEQQTRYTCYKNGAEFESFVDDTRRELLGKMRLSDTTIELPERLSYLVNNIDGDGMSFEAGIEFAVNNVLQTKFHALVVDYKGAPRQGETMTQQERLEMNPRAVINQYARENLVNWNFNRVNGVMQLAFAQFMEVIQEFDNNSGESTPVQHYLVLALDEDGYYYQAKFKEGESLLAADRDYPLVKGQRIKRLPVVFVSDEELSSDCLPLQIGFLWSIADLTLHRYRVSADYKETQRNIAPTIFTSGWKQGDVDIFKEANNNRSYVATGAGAVNNMPDGVTTDIISPSAEMGDYHWYFEDNTKKINAIGGNTNSSSVTMTATEAEIASAKQNALLNPLADNAEEAFTKAVFWCGVFEGLYNAEDFNNLTDDIVIELPRDFATPKLTVEEVGRYRELYIDGVLTREKLITTLLNGGWLTGDIKTLLSEIDEEPPI